MVSQNQSYSLLLYNYFRYYDPTTGRYITSDPVGLQGGLNTYAYVDNNPLYWVDPLGLVNVRNGRGGSSLGGSNRFNSLAGYRGGIGGRLTPSKISRGPRFPNLKDHANRHSNLHPNTYYNQAYRHALNGKKFNFRHDGQSKVCFISRTGNDSFTFTSTSPSGNTIFTHIPRVTKQYLLNKGITLPKGF